MKKIHISYSILNIFYLCIITKSGSKLYQDQNYGG